MISDTHTNEHPPANEQSKASSKKLKKSKAKVNHSFKAYLNQKSPQNGKEKNTYRPSDDLLD